jgi:hypothetical protein
MDADPGNQPRPETLQAPPDPSGVIPAHTVQGFAVDNPPPPAVRPAPAAAPPAALDLTAVIDEVRRSLGLGHDTGSGALSQYRTFGQFVTAMRHGMDAGTDMTSELAMFADQITGDNPGVMTPTWLKDVKGLIERAGRAIAAFGGMAPLPDSGLELSWPYVDVDLDTIVGEQGAELGGITSVKVPIKRGSKLLGTYAGGSTLSWQLLERSDPTYRELYVRILAIAYTRTCDKTFVEDAYAAATGSVDLPLAAGLTASDFKAALFDASSQVDDVTGVPATAVLVARDVWQLLGGMTDLYPQQYGLQNVAGTADASTLRIEVSGLTVTPSKYLPAATAVVGNDIAARWHGEPGRPAAADQILKLGTDVAIWGMGASGIYLPDGLVVITDVPVIP